MGEGVDLGAINLPQAKTARKEARKRTKMKRIIYLGAVRSSMTRSDCIVPLIRKL